MRRKSLFLWKETGKLVAKNMANPLISINTKLIRFGKLELRLLINLLTGLCLLSYHLKKMDKAETCMMTTRRNRSFRWQYNVTITKLHCNPY